MRGDRLEHYSEMTSQPPLPQALSVLSHLSEFAKVELEPYWHELLLDALLHGQIKGNKVRGRGGGNSADISLTHMQSNQNT